MALGLWTPRGERSDGTQWNKARIAQLDDVLLRTLRSGGSSRVPVRRGRRNPRSPPPSLPAAGGQRCGPGEEEEGGSRARRSGPTEGAGDPPGPGARTWPRKWVAGSGERRGSAWPGSSALSRSAAPRNAPRPRAPRSAARGGAMARGGGGKAGSLKDKLDGNELDLSLCDLSEVPVRELVSGWREGRCRLVPPPPPRGFGESCEPRPGVAELGCGLVRWPRGLRLPLARGCKRRNCAFRLYSQDAESRPRKEQAPGGS